jgi:hypothetical protein
MLEYEVGYDEVDRTVVQRQPTAIIEENRLVDAGIVKNRGRYVRSDDPSAVASQVLDASSQGDCVASCLAPAGTEVQNDSAVV